MKLTFCLRDAKATGETPLYCFVHFGNRQMKLATGLRVAPKNWNQDRRRVKRGTTGEAVTNRELAKIESELAGIFAALDATGVEATPEVVKARLAAARGRASARSAPLDLFASYDAYIDRGAFSPGTRMCHRKAKNHVEAFAKAYGLRLTFDRLDRLFWERFASYLITVKQMTTESAWNILKSVRAFLADAVDRGLTSTEDFRRVTRKSLPKGEASAKPYLSADELERVRSLDLSDAPRLARVRDLFVFLAYTGIRFGDSQALRPENVHGDVIRVVLQKNRKEVTVPLLSPAREILDRYDQRLPHISNQKANEYLGDVLKRAGIDAPVHVVGYRGTERLEAVKPKHELCGMHTAKRTYVSLLRQRGVSIEALMKATGNNRSSVERYILRTESDALDEIREAWEEVG